MRCDQHDPNSSRGYCSTTRSLRDDGNDSSKQDGPANQSSRWGSGGIPGARGGWGSSPLGNPSTENDLLPHELAARRRLEEALKPKEEATQKNPNRHGPRVEFNPQRQRHNRKFILAEEAEIRANRRSVKLPPPPPGKPPPNWAQYGHAVVGTLEGFPARLGPVPMETNRPVSEDTRQPDAPAVASDSTAQSSEPRETPPSRPLVRKSAVDYSKAKEEQSDTTTDKSLDNVLDNTFYSRDSGKTTPSNGIPKINPAVEDELITSHRHFDGLSEESPEKSKDRPKEPEITSTCLEPSCPSTQPVSQPVSQPKSKQSETSFEQAFDNAFYKPQDSSRPQGRKQENDEWPVYEREPPRNREPTRQSSRPTSELTAREPPNDETNGSGDGRRKARGKSEWDAEPLFEERQQAPQRTDRGRGGGKQRGGRGGGRDRESMWEDEMDEDSHAAYEEQLAIQREKAERKARKEAERAGPISIVLPELISISNLASALKIEKELFLEQLADLGFEGINLDSIMAGDTAALVAQEYGYDPTVLSDTEDLKPRPPPADPSVLPPRPPVVTIMGHVDHGKTTLLDYLRKASVALQEHGGITQHIGAFSVNLTDGKNITFLDTPGHAAFLSMRQRGANVTDIVVLVVAADDSVKPQTIEAIKHARAAKVPIIVAINKIDKQGAQIDHVKADLATNGVEIEDYGGDVQVVCVSGKTGQGMDDLEEISWPFPRCSICGPRPMGLRRRGTLRPGDYIVAGTTWAKIRHLRNEAGDEITEVPPGTPVEILGWRDLPTAGDEVIQAPDEGRAKAAVDYRDGMRDREKDAKDHEQVVEQRRLLQEQRALEDDDVKSNGRRRDYGTWGITEAAPIEGGAKSVNFVVKGDVHGSVEAVCASILEIGSNEVRPRILLAAPGHLTESDVDHAAVSRSTLVNFNLPIAGHIKALAEANGVPILDHNVIYHLHDDVKNVLSSHLSPELSTKVLGKAEVLQVFPINVRGRKTQEHRGLPYPQRRGREGELLPCRELESLKHIKKDIMEARKGGECGIGFEEFQDFKVGDVVQAYEEVQTKRSL
ncbi:hypothetical protein PG994_006585 [Apiospora phragmitis]|uniref:Tr-type G domain-containing protein n=1 Tax=Apiospora phragmitis TaxID=2905665 RepID=A0ABR1VFG9_9PEZI